MRSVLWKGLLALVTVGSLLTSLIVYGMSAKSASEYQNQISQQAEEIERLKEDMAGMETKISEQQELLNSRAEFLESVSEAKAVLAEAEKVTDISDSLQVITEAQETVFNEQEDYALIELKTALVQKETGRLSQQLAVTGELDEFMNISSTDLFEYNVKNLKTLPASHPARKALDAVGGTDIRLGSAPEVCGWEKAIACAYDNGIILIADRIAEEDYDFHYLVMMHEYAHQIQYRYEEEMQKSAGYEELFEYDFEWIADCMAAAKIPNYSSGYQYECSPAQIEYGENAWEGVFS